MSEMAAVAGQILDEPIPERPVNVHDGIAYVLRSVGVQSKRTGEGVSYAFRTIDDTYNLVHEHMATVGLTVRPEVKKYRHEPHVAQSGSHGRWWEQTIRLYFVGEDGSERKGPKLVGESLDYSDKGSMGCVSDVVKYGLVAYFTMPVEQPDGDAYRPESAGQVAKPPTPGSMIYDGFTSPCHEGASVWELPENERATKKGTQRPRWQCAFPGCKSGGRWPGGWYNIDDLVPEVAVTVEKGDPSVVPPVPTDFGPEGTERASQGNLDVPCLACGHKGRTHRPNCLTTGCDCEHFYNEALDTAEVTGSEGSDAPSQPGVSVGPLPSDPDRPFGLVDITLIDLGTEVVGNDEDQAGGRGDRQGSAEKVAAVPAWVAPTKGIEQALVDELFGVAMSLFSDDDAAATEQVNKWMAERGVRSWRRASAEALVASVRAEVRDAE